LASPRASASPAKPLGAKLGERAHKGIDDSGKFVGEIEYCKIDGTPIWCQVTGSLLDPANPDEGHVWLFEDVTARRAAEEALVESLWEQQLIFDNAMIGISYQRERTFLRCNRRCEEIFGYPPGGLRGTLDARPVRQPGGLGRGRTPGLWERRGDGHL
jgi:PAS domain-containing protein